MDRVIDEAFREAWWVLESCGRKDLVVVELCAAGRSHGSDGDGVAKWVRVDARDGGLVDVVGLCHEVVAADLAGREPGTAHPVGALSALGAGTPDLVACVDGFQHDPVWGQTVAAAVQLVSLGGVLVLAWDSPALRAEPDGSSPAAGGFDAGTYRAGLSLAAVLGVVCASAMRHGREVGLVQIVTDRSAPHRLGLVVRVVPVPHPAE